VCTRMLADSSGPAVPAGVGVCFVRTTETGGPEDEVRGLEAYIAPSQKN